MTTGNSYNPFLHGDVDEIDARLVAMLPKAPLRTPVENAAFEQRRQEGEARYREARYRALPPGVYRVLEQGGIAGWRYELEIDGEREVLRDPESSALRSDLAVFGNKELATTLARAEIARRHGDAAAMAATFRVVWGGAL
ncbi:hypothetical protein F6X40_36370 [Paraburkholderia sp. UCT31]|uniref:hypothetical protein n=1 Tax=Paraburkholderia sp. UCT31 TaxID=2615209 RepID=UPI00165552B7|nr:hypothetical protein [Paraburkholderia sp. UCT31]MBC8742017.1 hypothetical protein [Paraburkholderia sp. UCT31]